MQVRVPGTIQQCQNPRQKKILNVYDNFNTSVVIGSLRDINNFSHPGVRCHVMTLEARGVVSRLSHNNKYITVLSTLFVMYLCKYYEQLLIQIEQPAIIQTSNPFCAQQSESIISLPQ